jgi:acetyltransferase-like isoleucine patch superfamily enzyme
LCGAVKVGAGTIIGAGSVILPGVEIGENCIIGSGSVVTRNIPSNSKAYGNPAKIK